jgi:DNA-binding HxlR family transcriptional regulator
MADLQPTLHDRIHMDKRDATRLLNQMLDRVGDKWTMLVISSLWNGPVRFNALLRDVGEISHRMLTLTLRNLERNGLVKRVVHPTVPPKVEYELTDLGVSLVEPMTHLFLWIQAHEAEMSAARAAFDSQNQELSK